MYADALEDLVRRLRWARERRFAREALCAMDMTGEQADAVIVYAIERGTLLEQEDCLLPTAGDALRRPSVTARGCAR